MLEQEKITPTPMQALLVILAALLVSLVPQLLILFIFPGAEEGTFDPLGLKISLVAGEIGLAIVPLAYIRKYNYSLPDIMRWRKVPGKILFMSVLVGFSMAIVVDELDRLLQMIIPIPEEVNSVMAGTMKIYNGLDFILVVLSAVILAALVEEAVFRGFLQRAIEEHIDVTQAVVYASMAWAIIHFNPYIMVQIFIFGFFLGYITWRADSIIPAVICHAINNALALLYYNFDFTEMLPFYEWRGHVFPLLLLGAVFVAYKGIEYIDRYYRAPSSSNSASSE